MTDRTVYLLLRLCNWSDFEPAPGTFAPYPVSIVPTGVGFMVVYATEQEAIDAGMVGDRVVALKVREKEAGG